MDLNGYHEQRNRRREMETQFRELCVKCLQPPFGCYCAAINRFDPKMKFVILIHPIEARRRIATGRMSHLCLENSHLVRGENYTGNELINNLTSDSQNECVMLYPGPTSKDLSHLTPLERAHIFPANKRLVVFVIDGTWATARKMVRLSDNIRGLPRICFTPSRPSTFRVRKQPAPGCYSTIEAIHETIELLGEGRGFSLATAEHRVLLNVFDLMVGRQLTRMEGRTYRRREKEDPAYEAGSLLRNYYQGPERPK